MSWSIEEHIGEGRPWPEQVVVYRGETDESLTYARRSLSDVNKMVELMDTLAAENAKLREENERLKLFAKGDAIITDYWKDEDGTMHVLTTDGSSTYEYMRGGLAEENAKLRELVRDLWEACPADGYYCIHHCKHYDKESESHCKLEDRMRELGVGAEA